MSKVVYLLGAGASFGKRISTAEEIKANKNHGIITFINPAAPTYRITEGLPIVTEIPERIGYIIKELETIQLAELSEKSILPLGQFGGMGVTSAREMFIKDLKWLQEECASHATIDTFAKKLWLKKEFKLYKKVECLLALYFIIEQIINKPDNRYDTFLANILTSQLTIPDEICIVTWNYDSQFEIAYKEYLDDKLDKDLTTNLRLISRGDSIPPFFNSSIFKINGSATFREMRSLGAFCGKGADQELTESILIELLNYYVIGLDKNNNSCKLSFAWEDDSEKNKQYWLNLEGNTQDAVSLVVIGYTFPFFNRNIDRTLFDAMKNLRTIYIQDPNAENLIQNIRPVLSDYHSQTKIIPLTNVDQFYLPAELSI